MASRSDETWKDIEGYVGFYQVSSKGRVRSLDRTVAKKNSIQMRVAERILKQTKAGS